METEYDLKVRGVMIGETGVHGGGDRRLVQDFLEYLNGAEKSVSCATMEESVISHLAVFKAEQSRKSGAMVTIE